MNIAILIIMAYLIGSIPTAVWVSRMLYGIDIREHGSGNSGATNTFRILGSKAGTAVMIIDLLKGILAVKLAVFAPYSIHSETSINLQVFLGLFAVMGHIFPIWAEFRGGKGIATLFGMIIAIQPMAAVGMLGVFILMLYLTRYVSLSSIAASIAFPLMILFIFRDSELSYKIFAITAAFMVVLTHHKNINRIIHGNESKVGIFKKSRFRRRRGD